MQNLRSTNCESNLGAGACDGGAKPRGSAKAGPSQSSRAGHYFQRLGLCPNSALDVPKTFSQSHRGLITLTFARAGLSWVLSRFHLP